MKGFMRQTRGQSNKIKRVEVQVRRVNERYVFVGCAKFGNGEEHTKTCKTWIEAKGWVNKVSKAQKVCF